MPNQQSTIIDQPSGNVMLGIWMKILSVSSFVVMFSFLKSAKGISSGELTFFRSFFGLIPVFIWVIYNKKLSGVFYTRNFFGHFMRGLFGILAMMFSFHALTLLPLPETIAINYGEPLLLVILAAIFMGEKVRIYRWSAVVFGLIGVLIIIYPRLTVLGSENADIKASIGAISALISVFLVSIAMLLVRKLVFTEKTTTITIYFMLNASVISLCTLPFGWVMPTWYQFFMLVMAGFFGGIAQIFMTEAYRHAEPSTIAPFEYTSIILGLLSGYFIFGEVPTLNMIFGATIVVASGIFIILREAQVIGKGSRRFRALRHKNK